MSVDIKKRGLLIHQLFWRFYRIHLNQMSYDGEVVMTEFEGEYVIRTFFILILGNIYFRTSEERYKGWSNI